MTSINTPQQLGAAIRQARKNLKLTQSELARVSACGLRFIVELEAGKPTVRLENILRVIEALGGHLVLKGLPVKADED